MLTRFLPKLQDNRIINILNNILTSKWMIVVICFLTLVSNWFGLEILVLYLFTLIVTLTCLFSDDLLSLLTIAICGYFTFSRSNNPLSLEQTSIFLNPSTMVHIYIIIVIVVLVAGSRLVLDIIRNVKEGTYQGKKIPKLTIGFVLLGVAYIIGGLLTENYGIRTAFFGFVQIASLGFCYFYFYYTIDFNKVEKNYFAWLFLSVAVLLVLESLGMLYQADLFNSNAYFNSSNIFTGWGINNNVSALLVMMIPIPMYLVLTEKRGILYILITDIIFFFILLLQSRNGILCGLIIFFSCNLYVFLKQDWQDKIKLFILQTSLLFIFILIAVIHIDTVKEVFSLIITKGLNDSGRFVIYEIGLDRYIEAPIFGNGFYNTGIFQWGVNNDADFLPPRYHNTIIQLLASGGTFAMVAYSVHRLSTFNICLVKLTNERFFLGASFTALLITSLLDCHFFNIGPGFLYGALLLFTEIDYIKTTSLDAN